MKLSEVIQNFLNARRETHNDPTLLDRWHWGMETQINVSAKGGEPVEDRRNTYTNGDYEWWNIRVPKQAMSDPVWKDYHLNFPLEFHAEGIGMTGWEGMERVSKFVGFDFDAITGHAKGVGISQTELEEVQKKACALDFVEVRRSTSGSGIHLYVLIDDIPTANHSEHAALARAILGMMSNDAGFDFAAAIDCCGQNMWFWHKKMTPGNCGFELIKPSERSLGGDDVPLNWRDHIDVVTRKRGRVRLEGVEDEYLDPFEQLTSSRPKTPLDEEHKKVMHDLHELGYSAIWVPDHHLCQTHTRGLQEFAENNTIRGSFQTISEGRDPGTPNCFMFPLPKGGWEVCRFHQGVPEAPTWSQTKDGWTMCKFNVVPDLRSAASANQGLWDGESNVWVFAEAINAVKAAKLMGVNIPLQEEYHQRQAFLKKDKDGSLSFSFPWEKDDPHIDGFIHKKRKKVWYYSTGHSLKEEVEGPENVDSVIRAVLTPAPNSSLACFQYHGKNGFYTTNLAGAKAALPKNFNPQEATQILATALNDPWTLVHLPFQPENPGGRQLNNNAPQYAYPPADEPGPHPTFDRVINHFFADLKHELPKNKWAVANNIVTPYDYGMAWIASLLRVPHEPCAYLFAYGNQEAGKSFLIKLISMLVTKGCVEADTALRTEFNGILEGAVLAYIEEINLESKSSIYNKIKKLVTEDTIAIRKMRTDTYHAPNTLHWIQVSNERDACPIFPGDTRITALHVGELEHKIKKITMEKRMHEEAPFFMRTIMDLTLPQPDSRMRVPSIETRTKERAMHDNTTELEKFIASRCHEVSGSVVSFSEFFEVFQDWLSNEDKGKWSRKKVSLDLPDEYPVGLLTGEANKRFIGNISLSENPRVSNPNPFYLDANKRLEQ